MYDICSDDDTCSDKAISHNDYVLNGKHGYKKQNYNQWKVESTNEE